MIESKVSLLRVESYNYEEIERSIEEIMVSNGFNHDFINNKKIVVKPNLLTSALPDSGIVTHPVIIHSVIKIIKENGGIPVLVESPAFHPLDRVLKKTGLNKIIEDECVLIGDTKKTMSIYNEKGYNFKSFKVAGELAECDAIINLPKLKTHGLTYYTGAVKNLFGTINGLEKSKWHLKANNVQDFTSFLLDLYGAFVYGLNKKMIHIIDGVLGLEGEGPGTGGRARMAYALIGGEDAIAVDSVAIKVAGLKLGKVHTCVQGEKRGYGIADYDRIIIEGVNPDSFNNSFLEPESKSGISGWPIRSPLIKNLFVERPEAQYKNCTLCYQCRQICPAGAISKTADKKTPSFDYKKCIRCYCCMEICPENAIILKKGLLGRYIS